MLHSMNLIGSCVFSGMIPLSVASSRSSADPALSAGSAISSSWEVCRAPRRATRPTSVIHGTSDTRRGCARAAVMWGRAPSLPVPELWKRAECKAGCSLQEPVSSCQRGARGAVTFRVGREPCRKLLKWIGSNPVATLSRPLIRCLLLLPYEGDGADGAWGQLSTTNSQRQTSIQVIHLSPKCMSLDCGGKLGDTVENPLRYRENRQTPLAPMGFGPSYSVGCRCWPQLQQPEKILHFLKEQS